MNRFLVRIKAIEAFLGNKDEPIFWHYRVFAKSSEDAKATCRSYENVPAGAAMEVFPLPHWGNPWP